MPRSGRPSSSPPTSPSRWSPTSPASPPRPASRWATPGRSSPAPRAPPRRRKTRSKPRACGSAKARPRRRRSPPRCSAVSRPRSARWRGSQQFSDLRRQAIRFAVQAPVRDTDGAVAGDQQLGIAGTVALEGGPVAMVFPAIELDDELRAWPEGVDLVAQHVGVLLRGGQFALTEEGGEADLQGRAPFVGEAQLLEQPPHRP